MLRSYTDFKIWWRGDPLLAVEEDALTLLGKSAQAVASIIRHREQLDYDGLEHLPLVVPVGEEHSNPAHKIFQMALLRGLLQSAWEIAVCAERPSNLTAESLLNNLPDVPPQTIADLCAQSRPSDNLDVVTSLALLYTHKANHANATFHKYILDRGIPTRNVDAPFLILGLIDHDAPSLRACLEESHTIPDSFAYNYHSREGMYVRNQHIARLTSLFAAETGAKIVLLPIGKHHVTGSLSALEPCPFSENLTTQLKERGLPVFAVPVVKPFMPLVSRTAREVKFLRDTPHLVVKGLPDVSAIYDVVSGEAPYTSHLPSRGQEAAYVNSALVYMGMNDSIITTKNHDQLRHDLVDYLRGQLAL